MLPDNRGDSLWYFGALGQSLSRLGAPDPARPHALSVRYAVYHATAPFSLLSGALQAHGKVFSIVKVLMILSFAELRELIFASSDVHKISFVQFLLFVKSLDSVCPKSKDSKRLFIPRLI